MITLIFQTGRNFINLIAVPLSIDYVVLKNITIILSAKVRLECKCQSICKSGKTRTENFMLHPNWNWNKVTHSDLIYLLKVTSLNRNQFQNLKEMYNNFWFNVSEKNVKF